MIVYFYKELFMKKNLITAVLIILALAVWYYCRQQKCPCPHQGTIVKKQKLAYTQELHKKFMQAQHAIAAMQGKHNGQPHFA